MSLIKAILVGHVINQGRQFIAKDMQRKTDQENVTGMLRASRCHHLCL